MDLAREHELSTSSANPQAQIRLLDLAAFDADLDRLAHRRRTLPEIAAADVIAGRVAGLNDLIVAAETELSDLTRAQSKAEADVEQVRLRSAKDRELLDSGRVGSAKELANLTHEVESLGRRQGDLEELELEAMERAEEADRHRATLAAERSGLVVELETVVAARDAGLAEIAAAAHATQNQRDQLAAELPADLLAIYTKSREQHGGVGAARLHRGRCEGCQLELTRADIERIRSAAADEVLRCEECRRILVRTEESGL
ncbi:MAG: C4-type zinc ribbon domain-containing protein [Actinomycetes bacterium]